jgi:hypothetical protein
MLMAAAWPAPAVAQTEGAFGYRVDLAQVPNLEALRGLVRACTDLGDLEAARGTLQEAPDLEPLRSTLQPRGVVRFSGCPRRLEEIPGVLPLGGGLSATAVQGNDACLAFNGARLENLEGDYFGLVTSPLALDSIFNRTGPFGNTRSTTSIWNAFGVGAQLGSDSPWNPFSRGLLITRNGRQLGSLTINITVSNWVHPLTLAAVCFDITDRQDPNQ